MLLFYLRVSCCIRYPARSMHRNAIFIIFDFNEKSVSQFAQKFAQSVILFWSILP